MPDDQGREQSRKQLERRETPLIDARLLASEKHEVIGTGPGKDRHP